MTERPVQRPGRGAWLAVAVPAAIALYACWPVLAGGHLADDFNVNLLLEQQADGIDVAWGEVCKELWQPFGGAEDRPYFRPVVSLWIASVLALFGMDPVALHAGNLAHHVFSAAACAWIAWLLAQQRRLLAAWLAGAVVALHPVAVEPVAWWSACTASLCLALVTGCMASFATWRRLAWPGSRAAVYGFGALALLTQESAVMLPVALLAIDVLGGGLREPRRLLLRHLQLVPLWAGYLALRTLALGGLLSGHGETAVELLADQGWSVAGKLRALLAPFGPGLAPAWLWAAPAALGALLVSSWVRQPRRAVAAAGGLAWLLAHIAPGFSHSVSAELGASRVILSALPALALLAAAAAAATRGRAAGAAVAAALVAWLAGLGVSQSLRLDAYRHAWREVDAIAAELIAHAERATPAAPAALVTQPFTIESAPAILANLAFPLAERPFAQRDLPVVGLAFTHEWLAESAALLGDVGPIRAMRETGSPLLFHRPGPAPDSARLTALDPPRSLAPLRADGDVLRFEPGPVSPYAVEALELELEGEGGEARLHWITAADELPAYRALPAALRGLAVTLPAGIGRRRLVVDLSHHRGLLETELVGGLLGFRVEGEATPVAATALPRIGELPLSAPIEGGEVGLERTGIRAPAAETPLRMVVLTQASGQVFAVDPTRDVVWPDPVRRELARIMRVARQDLVWFWFEAEANRPERLPRRSRVDFGRLIDDGR